MKYSENRKITVRVTSDSRASLQRKNLWALLCVVFFCVFYFYNIVHCSDNHCFFSSFFSEESLIFKMTSLFDRETNRQTDWEYDFNYYFHRKNLFQPFMKPQGSSLVTVANFVIAGLFFP